ncbi:unnamed protein product [Prunus armeniaca]|uniref:Uncharacterized protein n=1 Tax=Prunus armeniaca TaxID=36596 RepID=A0A6J5VPD2_PRUAR|nr:unnamed protein product [Prunus armeniaca]
MHLHVWGCKAEARLYNPIEKKLDPRTQKEKFDAAIPPDYVSFTVPLKLCTETAAIHASPEAVKAQIAHLIIDQSLPSIQPDIGSSSASVPPSYPTMNIQQVFKSQANVHKGLES